jgi:hypothetical protein
MLSSVDCSTGVYDKPIANPTSDDKPIANPTSDDKPILNGNIDDDVENSAPEENPKPNAPEENPNANPAYDFLASVSN